MYQAPGGPDQPGAGTVTVIPIAPSEASERTWVELPTEGDGPAVDAAACAGLRGAVLTEAGVPVPQPATSKANANEPSFAAFKDRILPNTSGGSPL
jgi:hypothetical protein